MSEAQSVAVRFYTCEAPTLNDMIDAGLVSPCDQQLLDWLNALTAVTESWRPQVVQRTQLTQSVLEARAQAVAQCEASRFATQVEPQSGVSIRVASRLMTHPGGSTPTDADAMRAVIPIPFGRNAAAGGNSTGGTGGTGTSSGGQTSTGGTASGTTETPCPPVPFYILNRASVGCNTFPERTRFQTTEAAPLRNGSGEFAGAYICDSATQPLPWHTSIYKAFTAGSWRIRNDQIFNHYVLWNPILNPPPAPALAQRVEAFDVTRMSLELPGFPLLSALGPRWQVIHRYTHQESGRCFWFTDWITPVNSPSAAWLVTPDAGRGYDGNFTWRSFEAPGDGLFFDVEGTWLHESGVIGFAMNLTQVDVRYEGVLCERASTTVSEPQFLDLYTAPFLSDMAVFRESVVIRTIKPYKAAFRLVDVQTVYGVGISIRLRVINDFPFDACMAVVIPLGDYATTTQGQRGDVTVIRNLSGKSESDLVDFLLPLWNLTGVRQTFTMTDFARSVASWKHLVGLAFPMNAYPDGIYFNTNPAPGLTATSDGQKAEAWGFYDGQGQRFWHQPGGASSVPGTQTIFEFTPDPGSTLGSDYNTGLTVTLRIRGQRKIATPGVTRYQFPFGNVEVLSPYQFSPRFMGDSTPLTVAVTSTAGGIKTIVTQQTWVGWAYQEWVNGQPAQTSDAFWYADCVTTGYFAVYEWRFKAGVVTMPYTVVWDPGPMATAITQDGTQQYEAARWTWENFEITTSATMSRSTFISRYGARIQVASSAADGHDWNTRCAQWSSQADVEQTLITPLLSAYSDTASFRSMTHEVLRHPTLAVDRTVLSESDYPYGLPGYIDGRLHFLAQSGTQLVTVVWT
jgi:hypothetical protein